MIQENAGIEVKRMYILADDPFYELIRNYDLEGMEYFLMADEKPYRGLDSHRDAVIFAMQKVNEDEAEDIKQAEEEFGSEYDDKMHLYSCDIGKATARLMEARTLLYVPKMLKKEFLNREYEGINHNGLETNESCRTGTRFWKRRTSTAAMTRRTS